MRTELPTKQLDELVSLRSEKASVKKDVSLPYVGLEHIASGSPKLLGVANASASISTNAIFRRNDILFGKLRPNLRKTLLAPFTGYCSTDILVLRPKSGIDSSFASRIFQSESVAREAIATAIGTKMPRTSWKDLRKILVFCPPLSEQCNIAGILDVADDAIHYTEQVVAKLQQIKQGLLLDLLTMGIDEEDKIRDSERNPEQFKDSTLGRIPKEWDIVTIGKISTPLRGITYSSDMLGSSGRGQPFVNLKCFLKGGGFSPKGLKYFIGTYKPSDTVSPTDLLLASTDLTKNGDVIGAPALLPAELQGKGVLSSLDVMRLRMPSGCLTTFLYYLLCLPLYRNIMRSISIGTTVLHLDIEFLKRTMIPLPSLREQHRIADMLNTVDETIRDNRGNIAKLKALKRGLLDDLLTGCVRVSSPKEVDA